MAQLIADGLQKEILKKGNGQKVKKGDKVLVHCTGILADTQEKFWSTKDPGQTTFEFQCGVGQVIAGWDEGCLTMEKAERAKFTVLGHKGYGERGFPAWGITPNATLIFDIEILKINGQ